MVKTHKEKLDEVEVFIKMMSSKIFIPDEDDEKNEVETEKSDKKKKSS